MIESSVRLVIFVSRKESAFLFNLIVELDCGLIEYRWARVDQSNTGGHGSFPKIAYGCRRGYRLRAGTTL